MLFKLIIILAMSLGTAGIVFAINKLTRGALPKWVLPAAIAAVIIFYNAFDEYNWYDRKMAALGDNWVIMAERRPHVWWRPWTLVKPPVSAFLAINKDRNQPIDGHAGISSNILHTVGYPGLAASAPIAVDCQAGRFGPYLGTLDDVPWEPIAAENLTALCPG